MMLNRLQKAVCENLKCDNIFWVNPFNIYSSNDLQCETCYIPEKTETFATEHYNPLKREYGYCLVCKLWKNDVKDKRCERCDLKVEGLNYKDDDIRLIGSWSKKVKNIDSI